MLEEVINQRNFDEALALISGDVRRLARGKGLEVSGSETFLSVGEKLVLTTGRKSLELEIQDPKSLGLDGDWDAARVLSLRKPSEVGCLLALTSNGWFVSNPFTRGTKLPRAGAIVMAPGVHKGNGWIPVGDIVTWLHQEIEKVF
jgi:hypothetical protein